MVKFERSLSYLCHAHKWTGGATSHPAAAWFTTHTAPCRERILPEARVNPWLAFEKYGDRPFHLRGIAQMPLAQPMEGALLTGKGVEGEYTLYHHQQFGINESLCRAPGVSPRRKQIPPHITGAVQGIRTALVEVR